MPSPTAGGLDVIALVSGGKDSFFSLLHCQANGHRVVALANLHPALPTEPSQEELGPLGPPPKTTSASHPPAATISATPAASAAVSAPTLEPTPAAVTSGPSQDPDKGPDQGPDQDLSPAAILPDHRGGEPGNEVVPAADEDEHDLNSFMYQTVGHQVIPLYAEATGIPLYRRAITGGATQHGKEYSHFDRRSTASGAGADSGDSGSSLRGSRSGKETSNLGPGDNGRTADHSRKHEAGHGGAADEDGPDETESMVPLLEAIKKAHPEANAICAGAILSTYQRTRVESVAVRLGLTPLAYLWKFPVLPTPGPADPVAGSDAQLLDDMAAAGMEARIIKVASGGLDDSFLWTNVAGPGSKGRLARAMGRFGAAETGAVIGEGGEFETLVLDGPPTLFKKRVVVEEIDRRVVTEGGGSAWLSLRNARLEDKGDDPKDAEENVRIPDLLDPKFRAVLDALASPEAEDVFQRRQSSLHGESEDSSQLGSLQASSKLQQWSFIGSRQASTEAQTQSIVEQIRSRLQQHSLPPSAILSATVVLAHMSDFPTINTIYGTLFDAPNPPSRVTISCGSAAATPIAVHLTVHTALPPAHRHGLHVQSRSYWAPANIGPYSQAISVPVASLASEAVADPTASSSGGGARLVSIAGQIPLVPATMALPLPTSTQGGDGDDIPLQLTLSLQHLWRIGAEMGVQWWTSAVAYFPASPLDSEGGEMAVKARLAGRAWRMAHLRSGSSTDDDEEDEEEKEGGPDLWDRRYNSRYMTFSAGGGSGGEGRGMLPDRSVLAGGDAVVPPLFVAEVEELPRGAGVEWHAHLGVAHAGEDNVSLWEGRLLLSGKEVAVSQVIVKSAEVRFVQTIVAEGLGVVSCRHEQAAREALARLGEVGSSAVGPAAVVRYVDVGVLKANGDEGEGIGPVVPCRSLWDEEGGRLAAVTVYQNVFE